MAQLDFSVIVPVYNERRTVRQMLLDLLEKINWPSAAYEVIAIDDGSTDGSGDLLIELAADEPRLRVIRHDRNWGYGAAIKSGARRAQSDLVVLIDADESYPAEKIPELVKAAAGNAMVIAERTGKAWEKSFWRSVPRFFLKRWISWIGRSDARDFNSGFRAVERQLLLDSFRVLPNGYGFKATLTLALLANFHAVKYLPVEYRKRIGRSRLRPIRDTLGFVEFILRTGMTFAPLRLLAPLLFGGVAVTAVLAGLDISQMGAISNRTILVGGFTITYVLIGLLADMIDKRA